MSHRPVFATVTLALAVACSPVGARGTLTARWVTGADTAALTMPATATWCPLPGRLDIRAFWGDSALGVTIFPSDSNTLAGTYRVITPGARTGFRPAAGVALRWVGKVELEGWWGDSGSVTITGGQGRALSGQGQASLVSNLGQDSVTSLEFSFRGLRVTSDTLCDARVLPVGVPIDSAAAAGTPVAPGVP